MARWRWANLLAPLAIAAPAMAQDAGAAIGSRCAELIAILNGEGEPGATFSRQYLDDVPEARLREIASRLRAQLGRATGYRSVTMHDADRAEMVIAYERGTAHAEIVFEPLAGRITGFWIDAVIPAEIAALQTFEAIAAQVARLPGSASLAVVQGDGPPLASLRAEQPLAIGSAFKLVVLAELVRVVDAGERGWNDRVPLGPQELPAGQYRGQPAGTRVSLRHLAEAMIRTSDNSATDVLLRTLGREQVEAMQVTIGFRHAALNLPFLSTMELFKLKGVDGGALGRRYIDADVAGRRRLLDQDVARRTGVDVGDLFADGRPLMIDRIEWFASPMDLVRAMRWFAAQADRSAGAEALRILGLNPGPGASLRGSFAYLGYKGGLEPGVLNMTMLVRDKGGRWTVATTSWNDPANGVDETRLAALMTRALALLAQR